MLLFLSSRWGCLATRDDDLLSLMQRALQPAYGAGNSGLYYLCTSLLLPSNGERTSGAFEDTERALWVAGT